MRFAIKILAVIPAMLLSGCYVTVEPGTSGNYYSAPDQSAPTPTQIVQPVAPQVAPQPAQIVPQLIPGQTWHPHWHPRQQPQPGPVPPPYQPYQPAKILPGQTLHPQIVPPPRPILPGQTQHLLPDRPVPAKPLVIMDPCKDPKNPNCKKPTTLVMGGAGK